MDPTKPAYYTDGTIANGGGIMAGLGDLERAVMDTLWDAKGPLSVRDVHVALSARDLAYTTVMTVLVRLVGKGLAERELDGRAWQYRAARSRQELTADAMNDALGTDEAGRSAALVAFVEKVTPDEADLLRKALAELEQSASAASSSRRR